MKELIKALQIFGKYTDGDCPSHCEHDVFYMYVVPSDVSNQDKQELEELGFHAEEDEDHFYSFTYGSC